MERDETCLAVCGAHMRGLPLNDRLTARGARFARCALTASEYRLFLLGDVDPPRPGLIRVGPETGAAIKVELWRLSWAALGRITAEIDLPLAIGTLRLADGSRVTGFVCEGVAALTATDITHTGGWRTYLAAPSRPIPIRGTSAP